VIKFCSEEKKNCLLIPLYRATWKSGRGCGKIWIALRTRRRIWSDGEKRGSFTL